MVILRGSYNRPESMDREEYQARCAICQAPADTDCPNLCESNRLKIAVEQAETRWLEAWLGQTREWVTDTAVQHVTDNFRNMKSVRLENHNAYMKTIPYFALYEKYQGRPPLHHNQLMELRRQIYDADVKLQLNIDDDWRQCVMPALLPSSKYPALERAHSTTGTSSSKKAHRSTKSSSAQEKDLEAIAKHLQRSGFGNNGNSDGSMRHSRPPGFPPGSFQSTAELSKQELPASIRAVSYRSLDSNSNVMAQLMQSSSRTRATSPVQSKIKTRSAGTKRHSRDHHSSGRATAPVLYAPYAPPEDPWQ